MEEKKPITHFVAATVISLVLIVYTLLLQFTGNGQNRSLGLISYFIILVGLILFINLYGKAMNNQVTFGNLFGYGFKTTAVLALIMIAFTIIFFILFPNVKEKIFEMSRQSMEDRGKMTDSEIDQAMQTFKRMFWVFTVGGIILFYAIIGAIGSLIGAAVTKKKPYNPLEQLDRLDQTRP